MTKNRAGWYADPTEDAPYRWWTGSEWGPETSDDLRHPPPATVEPETLSRWARMSTLGKVGVVSGVVFGAFMLLGMIGNILDPESGSDFSPEAASAGKVDTTPSTTPETTKAPTTTAPTTTARPTTAPPTTTSPTTTSPTTPGPPEPVEVAPAFSATMPDYQCWILQDAQDDWQAQTDRFFSDSHDVLYDRMQLVDSNWIVVEQTPTAGSPLPPESDYPDFGVVKLSEADRFGC